MTIKRLLIQYFDNEVLSMSDVAVSDAVYSVVHDGVTRPTSSVIEQDVSLNVSQTLYRA